MIKDLPQIGMGTWMSEDKQELLNTIKVGMAAGYKHIDTAQIYDNETQIGEVLKELDINKDDLFITTKIYALNYKYHVTESLNESLRRLQVEYVDLILLHSPLTRELEAKAYKELMIARDKGLVKYVGVSNFTIDKLEAIHKATGEWPYVNQIVAAPTFRNVEIEKFCEEKGIKLTGYSIMKPYFAPSPFFENSGLSEEEKKAIDAVAKKYNKDAGQVLNRWANELGYAVIPKSSKASRVTSNIKIFDFDLSTDEMDSINSMNKADQELYRKLIATWTENITEEQLKKGLLFDRNFKPGK